MILRNGSDEPDFLVSACLISVQEILRTDPISFFELVTLARDPNHQLWGEVDGPIAKRLQGLALLGQDGKMHDSIRHIVMAAVEDEGMDMHLVSPKKVGS